MSCPRLKYLPVSIFISFLFMAVLLQPGRAMSPEAGDPAGDSGSDSDDTVASNASVVAGETVRIILDHVDSDNNLLAGDDRIIPQPVYLDMDVPASVRDQMYRSLLEEGIRLADSSGERHVIRIEWEPENTVIIERGGSSRRILSSDLFFTWLDPDQEIQIAWSSSFHVEDEIPSGQVSDLAGTWNPARFHHREESRRFSVLSRLAEPAIITGAVAVTIYLLYNVRS